MKLLPSNSILFILDNAILSVGMNNNTIHKDIKDTTIYGKSRKKNDSNGMLETVYITILCGAPIGSTIHPTFAAIVCRETVRIIKSVLSTFFNANIENGTNMIKETSFVMNIELKKQMNTKIKTSSRAFPILANNFLTKISKIAKFFKISTITIITKSRIIVSQLI
jgi:hypothetical protein